MEYMNGVYKQYRDFGMHLLALSKEDVKVRGQSLVQALLLLLLSEFRVVISVFACPVCLCNQRPLSRLGLIVVVVVVHSPPFSLILARALSLQSLPFYFFYPCVTRVSLSSRFRVCGPNSVRY